MSKQRECSGCHQVKPEYCFSRQCSFCRDCKSIQSQRWKDSNRTKYNIQHSRSYSIHHDPDGPRGTERLEYEAMKSHEWYLAHREYALERQRKYSKIRSH